MTTRRDIIAPTAAVACVLSMMAVVQSSVAQTPEAPAYLQPGDILFVEARPWVDWWTGFDNDGWDHVAMYIGDDLFVEATDYPGSSCVRITPLWVFNLWAESVAFGTVTPATGAQRLAAVEFALSQLERPYQHADICWWANADPDDPEDFFSDWWYCSELVWAAYLNQGINIDADPAPPPPEEGGDGIHLWVSPQELADDDDVDLYVDGPPGAPVVPDGPTDVYRFSTHVYSTSAIDPDNEDMYYQWDWGEYLGPWYLFPRGSGDTVVRPHTWLTLGTHNVKVRAKDYWGNVGPWSPVLPVTVHSWFGGGGGSCFLAGSRVTMADGSQKNIENIEIGEAVRSYDAATRREIIGCVRKTLRHEADEMGEYYVVINNRLRVTPNHGLYMNGDWIRAGDVTVGCLLGTTGIEVTSVERIYEPVPTYHLIVERQTSSHGLGAQEGEAPPHGSVESVNLPYIVEEYLTNKGSDQEFKESQEQEQQNR